MSHEFAAHAAAVTCVRVGPRQGTLLVTGGEDRRVNLWAIGRPDSLLSLVGHTQPVSSLAIDAAEQLVVAGATSGALKLWDLEQAKAIRTLLGHRSQVAAVEFHPFGDFFASASADGSVKVWDIKRKASVLNLLDPSGAATSTMKFSPDGKWLITASSAANVAANVWDLSTGRLLHRFAGSTSAQIAFHPRELVMATLARDGTQALWDMETMAPISSGSLGSGSLGSGSVDAARLVFSHTGSHTFSVRPDELVAAEWEPALRRVWSAPIPAASVMYQDAVMLPSGRQIVAAGFSDTYVQVALIDVPESFAPVAPPAAAAAAYHHHSSTTTPIVRSATSLSNLNPLPPISPTSTAAPAPAPIWHSHHSSSVPSLPRYDSDYTLDHGTPLAASGTPRAGNSHEGTPRAPLSRSTSTIGAAGGSLGNLTPSASAANVIVRETSLSNPALYTPRQGGTGAGGGGGVPRSASSSFRAGAVSGSLTDAFEQMAISRPVSSSGARQPPAQVGLADSHGSDAHTPQPVRRTPAPAASAVVVPSPRRTPDPTSEPPLSVATHAEPHQQQQYLEATRREAVSAATQVTPVAAQAKVDTASSPMSAWEAPGAASSSTSLMERAFTPSSQGTSKPAGPGPAQQLGAPAAAPAASPPRPLPPSKSAPIADPTPVAAIKHSLSQQRLNSSGTSTPSPLLPPTGTATLGLDLAAFHRGQTQRIPLASFTVDPAAMSQAHATTVAMLSQRQRVLAALAGSWNPDNLKSAVAAAAATRSRAVWVDVLRAVAAAAPRGWSLDVCVAVLPWVAELMFEPYADYVEAACTAVQVILDHFTPLIIETIAAFPVASAREIDFSREERFDKCQRCKGELVQIKQLFTELSNTPGPTGNKIRAVANAFPTSW
ncbi:hypothetical protein H9P43_002906 [Blastocladiella emersonii ATCC 22665]|nr:hypothetical protein H9P43_002906 [Blastocladiella emersonii ATCC 22665]